MLHSVLHGGPLDEFIRLEPMLGCILAGFALCNFCGVRRRFGDVLRKAMPLVLVFFFLTTGMSVELEALAHSWPAACGLFLARLVSIRTGYSIGAALAPVSANNSAATLARREGNKVEFLLRGVPFEVDTSGLQVQIIDFTLSRLEAAEKSDSTAEGIN